MNDQKQNRAEPPDKALFNAMMGVFFLLFALAPAYWAFYKFGEYRHATDFIEQLKENSRKTNTPEAGQEYAERITSFSSQASRYRLEMLLSGAGAFLLFGISALFFAKSFKSRGKKNFYERLNPQTIPIPSGKIEIRYKKFYDFLLIFLFVFFGGMLLLVLYQTFTNKFITPENALIRSFIFGVPVILILAIISYLMIRAKRNAVKIIDVSGIKRGDGRHFEWTDFCGKITQTAINRQTQRRYIWRIELAFANGETAWFIPNRIKNYKEVSDFLEGVPTATLKIVQKNL